MRNGGEERSGGVLEVRGVNERDTTERHIAYHSMIMEEWGALKERYMDTFKGGSHSVTEMSVEGSEWRRRRKVNEIWKESLTKRCTVSCFIKRHQEGTRGWKLYTERGNSVTEVKFEVKSGNKRY